MLECWPAYYSLLPPFRDLFATGTPILTYHKLGPRPRGVRLKGLYVGADLFTRQLAELRAAGYVSGSLDDLARTAPPNQQVVVTFDDGFQNVLTHALKPLAQHRFRAVQFLLADRLGKTNAWDLSSGEVPEPLMDAAAVRDWLAAGHLIGSHTLTHPRLTQLPLAEAREEIVSSKKKLEDLFDVPIEHFCYPYGDWNPAVRDLVAAAGYRTACTTDFGVNGPEAAPLELKRISARYPTRNLKALLGSLGAWVGTPSAAR